MRGRAHEREEGGGEMRLRVPEREMRVVHAKKRRERGRKRGGCGGEGRVQGR